MKITQKKEILLYVLSGTNIEPDLMSVEVIASMAQEVFYPKQSTILDIGKKQNDVYLVVHGLARSYYIDEKGNDITKLFMRENEIIIGEALFMEESLEVFEAVEDLLCLKFDAKELKKIFLSNPFMAQLYIALLEDTIKYKMRREYAFQCMDATQRYLEFQKTYPKIEDRLPQNLIASYLGITKESLSRIRKNFYLINKC
ncbi:MAG: Crp/Fnr family transcriptional regulator [bacterium]|nr:Crp/Fnr family transcriptional regulator [bacterium]